MKMHLHRYEKWGGPMKDPHLVGIFTRCGRTLHPDYTTKRKADVTCGTCQRLIGEDNAIRKAGNAFKKTMKEVGESWWEMATKSSRKRSNQ